MQVILHNLPKHFDKLVCLSIKTLADMTLPNGQNACANSWSVNSWGRWYINKFAPSGPSTCFPVVVEAVELRLAKLPLKPENQLYYQPVKTKLLFI